MQIYTHNVRLIVWKMIIVIVTSTNLTHIIIISLSLLYIEKKKRDIHAAMKLERTECLIYILDLNSLQTLTLFGYYS